MPAKLLSCSFLMLLLPWFSLSLPRSLVLFVSPSLPLPRVCCCFFFLFFFFLTSSTSLCRLPLPSRLSAISIAAARRDFNCCGRWLQVRGEDDGQAEAANHARRRIKLLFLRKSQDLCFQTLHIFVRIFIDFFLFPQKRGLI